jgi:hypothetical protein
MDDCHGPVAERAAAGKPPGRADLILDARRPALEAARKVSGRPKRCKLAHTVWWERSYERLELVQLPGQLRRLSRFSTACGITLTCPPIMRYSSPFPHSQNRPCATNRAMSWPP